MSRKIAVFFSAAGIGVFFDQITKYVVRNWEQFEGRGLTVIPGWFDLVHAENPGAAFGMLGSIPTAWRLAIFLTFTAIAIGVILDMWRRLPKNDWFMSLTLGLILSGAVGNGIDRVLKQTVTDFLRVYTENPGLKTWLIDTFGMAEWPAFNIADAALVVGVGLFLVHYLFLEDKDEEEAADTSTPAGAAEG